MLRFRLTVQSQILTLLASLTPCTLNPDFRREDYRYRSQSPTRAFTNSQPQTHYIDVMDHPHVLRHFIDAAQTPRSDLVVRFTKPIVPQIITLNQAERWVDLLPYHIGSSLTSRDNQTLWTGRWWFLYLPSFPILLPLCRASTAPKRIRSCNWQQLRNDQEIRFKVFTGASSLAASTCRLCLIPGSFCSASTSPIRLLSSLW